MVQQLQYTTYTIILVLTMCYHCVTSSGLCVQQNGEVGKGIGLIVTLSTMSYIMAAIWYQNNHLLSAKKTHCMACFSSTHLQELKTSC